MKRQPRKGHEKGDSRGTAFFLSRDDWTRTSDLVVPNDARYQLRHIPFFLPLRRDAKDNEGGERLDMLKPPEPR